MGFNTPAVILNDMLHEFETNAQIGQFIADSVRANGDDRRARGWTQAIKVLPSGHSSGVQIVAVGGNTIRTIGYGNCSDTDEQLLRKLADQLGFRVIRKKGQSND